MEPPMAGPASGATELRFSTKAMPVAAWREEFARGFLRLDIEPEQHDRFQADATIRAFPGLKIASCTISASRWRRTRALLDPGTEYFGLMFGMEGPALLSQRGRTLELGAGDAATCSHAEPADLVLPREDGRHVGLVVPFKPMAALVPDLEGTIPRRITRHSAPLRLLVGYLNALADATTLADPELCRTVVTHVHDLIALALGAGRDSTELANGRGLRAARLRAVKTDVLANLASHELSAATVARRQGITPRYVHMLFSKPRERRSRISSLAGGWRWCAVCCRIPATTGERSLKSPSRPASATSRISTACSAGASAGHRAMRAARLAKAPPDPPGAASVGSAVRGAEHAAVPVSIQSDTII